MNKQCKKSETEYKKYHVKTLYPVEKVYLENIEKTILKNSEE